LIKSAGAINFAPTWDVDSDVGARFIATVLAPGILTVVNQAPSIVHTALANPAQVFAYRLIACDTIEEKVLQLQNSKRELADAIVDTGDSVLRALGKEDLEMLLA
jgi:hypothetical protein